MTGNMPRIFLFLFAITLGAVGVSAFASGAEGTKTRVTAEPLTGYHETPPISSVAAGSFVADIDEDKETITYELTYGGLSTPALFAHIHFGSRFLAGGVAAFLCGGGGKPACPSGTTDPAVVTGVISAADIIGPTTQGIASGEFAEVVRAIRSGVAYANVHSTNFPSGEIRGQINDDNQRQP